MQTNLELTLEVYNSHQQNENHPLLFLDDEQTNLEIL